MDEAPTPIGPQARFPSIQFVFCLACLGMASYTWMRFSYMWDFQSELLRQQARVPTAGEAGWPCQAFIRILPAGIRQEHQFLGPVIGVRRHMPDGRDVYTVYSDMAPVVGRYKRTDDPGLFPLAMPHYMDTAASRFHPGSVAGLVVGAMGAFIFGLYLRGWFRERKARE